ncbi:MAG: hypothetical protein K9M80_04815 [Candidatus Marinimicrobia bacterium]|nr:hypothetical protein [Candidatus Neomarinimicrobiota bacterium]
MSNFKKITVLDNEIQSKYLDEVLKEKGIPHVIKSYRDSAYDGLFQNSKGWGHIEAPDEYEDEILDIIKELDEQAE